MVCYILLVFFGICISSFNIASADDLTIYFTGNNISTSFWINNNQSLPTLHFSGGSIARFILLNESLGNQNGHKLGYGCGFFCRTQASCEFGIILVDTTSSSVSIRTPPQVVWSANRDSPVGENATMEFSHGSLVLRDSGGEGIWSSNSSSQSVVGMSISSGPNLVLFNSSKGVVWQSFDHPTDTLLPGQMLRRGQTLSSTTLTNSNMSTGPFFLSISHGFLTASIHTDVLVPYFVLGRAHGRFSTYGDSLQYVRFEAGHVTLAFLEENDQTYTFDLAETQRHQSSDFLRLDPDGGWRIYSWMLHRGWRVVFDFMYNGDQCQLPLRCGRYGVCKEGQCSCPKALDGVDYFAPLDAQSPELGCNQIDLLTSKDKYQLVGFGNLSYFSYADPQAALSGIQTLHECKAACLRNSSCQAAFFTYESEASVGQCYLSSEVLSIRAYKVSDTATVSSAYLKVRVFSGAISPMSPEISSPPAIASPKSSKHQIKLLLSCIFIITIFISSLIFVLLLWKIRGSKFVQDPFEQVEGMPARFSYKDICIATENFCQEIGRGGFGIVFKGVLKDGTLVAVKQLKKESPGMDEFLAEVRTIGSIHHINLVGLIGFCAEKSHRILVFEYMSNGSLDNWIFNESKQEFDSKTKLKVINDIAKGLAYLHEECRQRIAHLDVKPHNILLDDRFNAKISDFGLAKFIDRDRSQFTSTDIRGTLGYLAPEWQHSDHITVKADVYSFGIVALEIFFSRRNLDYSQSSSNVNLITCMYRKAENDHLIGIVKKQREETTNNYEDELTMRVVKLGVWCTIVDYKKRPSMSEIVKFLEDLIKLEDDMSFNIPPHYMDSSTNNEVIYSGT